MAGEVGIQVAARERVVFFEPQTGGHQWYHVRYLLSALVQKDWGFTAEFMLHPDVARRVEAFLGGVASLTPVCTRVLQPAEQASVTCHPLWLRALRRWGLLKRYLEVTGAQHWHFMRIDEMQVPLALGWTLRDGVTLTGVLFQPSVHYATNGIRSRGRERLRDLRKAIAYRRMLKHPSLSALLSLDPLFPDYARETLCHGSKVLSLPDPIPTIQSPVAGSHVHEAVADVPKGRVRFLMFGALQERKGILQTLEALRRLSPDDCARIAVVFAGCVDSAVRSEFYGRLRELAETQPAVCVKVVDRFFEDEELSVLLYWCDFVLAPYQRFVGSSGVLVWAAATHRPVVTQDYGLLGILTTRYGLGITVDSTDPGRLGIELARLGRETHKLEVNRSGRNEFMAGRSPSDFADVILNAIRAARSTATRAPRP